MTEDRVFRAAKTEDGAEYFYIEKLDGQYPVRTFFTGRNGGVSEGPFGSLNMSFSTMDEPARVEENRRRVLNHIGLAGYTEVALGQVHRAGIACIRKSEPDFSENSRENRKPGPQAGGFINQEADNTKRLQKHNAGESAGFRTENDTNKVKPWMKQSAGADYVLWAEADAYGSESGTKRGERLLFPETDAVITDAENVILTSLHADCIPVWLYDTERNAAGLAHAGWRGTRADIAAKTAQKMSDKFGCQKENILAFIGPGISRCCFETGAEVAEEFDEMLGRGSVLGKTGQFGTKDGNGKYHLDLKEINAELLRRNGIKNIFVTDYCTSCSGDLFFSYRRDNGVTGRMVAGIMLLPKEGCDRCV